MSSASEAIKAFLPYLRRYARALTGSQELGDRCVRFCLEAILKDPHRLEGGRVDRRVQLFTEFHKAWRRLDEDLPHVETGLSEGVRVQLRRCIAGLPAQERQVLLLSSLEGFSIDDVSAILDLPSDEVVGQLHRAREHIWRQAAAEILIIEDDPIIAMNNVQIVEDLGHKVVGVAARKDQAVALAARASPTLVLADIKLERGDNGISAVKEILEKIAVPVIFVTGHPEMLLTGEAVEPAFVITKPFDPDTLKTAIGHVLSLHGPQHLAAASF
jgi:DNA-directed RNA polymerase specialized sigma24 family protein/CheY-like chemotaxis protein